MGTETWRQRCINTHWIVVGKMRTWHVTLFAIISISHQQHSAHCNIFVQEINPHVLNNVLAAQFISARNWSVRKQHDTRPASVYAVIQFKKNWNRNKWNFMRVSRKISKKFQKKTQKDSKILGYLPCNEPLNGWFDDCILTCGASFKRPSSSSSSFPIFVKSDISRLPIVIRTPPLLTSWWRIRLFHV